MSAFAEQVSIQASYARIQSFFKYATEDNPHAVFINKLDEKFPLFSRVSIAFQRCVSCNVEKISNEEMQRLKTCANMHNAVILYQSKSPLSKFLQKYIQQTYTPRYMFCNKCIEQIRTFQSSSEFPTQAAMFKKMQKAFLHPTLFQAFIFHLRLFQFV